MDGPLFVIWLMNMPILIPADSETVKVTLKCEYI